MFASTIWRVWTSIVITRCGSRYALEVDWLWFWDCWSKGLIVWDWHQLICWIIKNGHLHDDFSDDFLYCQILWMHIGRSWKWQQSVKIACQDANLKDPSFGSPTKITCSSSDLHGWISVKKWSGPSIWKMLFGKRVWCVNFNPPQISLRSYYNWVRLQILPRQWEIPWVDQALIEKIMVR